MKLLSKLIDRLLCPAIQSESTDDAFVLGCRMVGSAPPADTAKEEADLLWQQSALFRAGNFLKPNYQPDKAGPDGVFNDLFHPGQIVDADGIRYVHFPVPVRMSLSSTFLEEDWRFVALAAATTPPAIRETRMTIVTALDATGRRVQAVVDQEVLTAAARALDFISALSRKVERPGPQCRRCNRSGTCTSLENYLTVTPGADPGLARQDATKALLFQRMEIDARIGILDKQKVQADQELVRHSSDGILRLGGGMDIDLPSRKGKSWDARRVRLILESAGLPSDPYFTVKSGPLQAALDRFPAAVRQNLLTACTETSTEPSIAEAMRHGALSKPAVNHFLGTGGKP